MLRGVHHLSELDHSAMEYKADYLRTSVVIAIWRWLPGRFPAQKWWKKKFFKNGGNV